MTFGPEVVGQNIIAIGGGNDDTFLPTFVEQSKQILIIAAASQSCERLNQSSTAYKEAFLKLGAKSVDILVICDRDDAGSVQEEGLNNYNMFLPGGDQQVFMERISGTSLETAILNAIKQGRIYCGSSATTACIGDLMISDPVSDGNIVVEKGLGLVPNTIFDQHYRQRHRESRLKKVIESHPGYKGIGIDERTALFIRGNEYKVVGEGQAHYVGFTDPIKEKLVVNNGY
jgi:cyanophycinase